MRGRTRGRNSPVPIEMSEETLENKRTTRSAKSKGKIQYSFHAVYKMNTVNIHVIVCQCL